MPDLTRATSAGRTFPFLLLALMLCMGTTRALATEGSASHENLPLEGPDLDVTNDTENTVESANLKKVVDFLAEGLYLGWEHDPYIRPTGDVHRTTDGKLIDGTTHHRVRIYYSPAVADWLHNDRVGELPDRSMIVKEMYQTVAPFYPEEDPVIGWAAMVKKTGASHGGWHWTIYFKSEFRSMATMGTFNYSFCLTCHASTTAENTFADLDNLTGENAANSTGRSYLEVADPLFFQNIQNAPAEADPRPRGKVSPHFAGLYARPGIYPYTKVPSYLADRVEKPFPSTDFDHVWNPAGLGDDALSYITSDSCIGCHDATLLVDTQVPNMLIRRKVDAHEDAEAGNRLFNLSVYSEWRSSPMGMAGRDPIFFAQLESELELHAPEHRKFIQDTCLSCHGVMGERQLETDGVGHHFQIENVFATEGKLAKYGALARDGISCEVCHQMSPATFPEPDSGKALPNSGRFLQGPWNQINGPTAPGADIGGDIRPLPMQNALGITPQFDPHLKKAELCGTCHTIELPVYEGDEKFRGTRPVTDEGVVLLSEAHEQDTYLEWLYSAYQNSNANIPGDSETARTCQDCHMRSTFMGNDTPIAARLANIQDSSWPIPPAENLASADEITVPVRPELKRHTFFGMNLFALSMYRQFGESVFGLLPDTNPPAGTTNPYDLAIENGKWQIEHETATVELLDVMVDERELGARVRVTNQAGHRLPSGVGFRRAWLELAILDAQGKVLWGSGQTDDQGVILGANGKALPSEFTGKWEELQPHWEVIRDQGQVQIYEERYINAYENMSHPEKPKQEIRLSTSFLGIGKVVKDNRLLPRGYKYEYILEHYKKAKKGTPEREKWESLLPQPTVDPLPPGAASPQDDLRYTSGSGSDEVSYRIPLDQIRGAASIRVRLNYQNIPPYYLRDRFAVGRGPETQRLHYLVGHLQTEGTPVESWKIKIAEATANVPRRHR